MGEAKRQHNGCILALYYLSTIPTQVLPWQVQRVRMNGKPRSSTLSIVLPLWKRYSFFTIIIV